MPLGRTSPDAFISETEPCGHLCLLSAQTGHTGKGGTLSLVTVGTIGPDFIYRMTMLEVDTDFCPHFADGETEAVGGRGCLIAIEKMQSRTDLQYRKTPVWNTALTVTVFLFRTPAAFENSFVLGQDEVFPSAALQRAEPWTGQMGWGC